MAELWTTGITLPKVAVRMAAGAEWAGWDGIAFVDSQNLAGDVWVALALAAAGTDRIKLATGVTNCVTRHPAVTAAAVAHVQAESGGRAVLGIGRGDSSLAYIGLAPASVSALERYVERVQAYLRGEAVSFEDATVGRLGLGRAPEASRLEWLRPGQPKVPVDVVAAGPRVIGVGARLADRVTFAVGADPERVRWAVSTARAARDEAGLDPKAISLGAFVNVVVHPDVEKARELASGGLASFARFNVMHGSPVGPIRDADRAVLERVHASYDMTRHTWAGSSQAAALSPEFIDRFGVVGPVSSCVERLHELLSLGLDRLVIVGGSAGADRDELLAAHMRFMAEVMPALRSP